MADILPIPAAPMPQSTEGVAAASPSSTESTSQTAASLTQTPGQHGEGFGINFIRDQRKRLEEHVEQDKKIARYTMIGLVVFMLVLVGVMIAYYLFSLQQKKIAEQTANVSAQLSTMSTLEKEYIIYAKKIKLLAALDAERMVKRNASSFFYGLVPPGNVLREVRTDDELNKDTIAFTIESPEVFALLRMLNTFGSREVYDKGYVMSITGLRRDQDGTYSIEGNMNYARATDMAKLGEKK